MLMEYFDRYAAAHKPYKGGAWCYEDGLVYRGLECLHRATGEERWLAHILRMIAPQIEGSQGAPELARYDPNEYNIDNILSGRALLYLHDVTAEARYLETAELLVHQLATHPRTHSGVYWHKLRYPWQVWLDGLYMGPPFQIGYGLKTGNDALVSDALTQLDKALDVTAVPETGLYAHAFDEARKQRWADPVTGRSQAHWARALGWLAMALVDVAELVGAARFAPLEGRTVALLERVTALRKPGGLWLQVIDQPGLKGNYEEASASAMFVYALLKAQALGLIREDARPLHELLVAQVMERTSDNQAHMINICHVAGLGMYENRFRDGSAAYYVSERLATDDPKGVGPLMMAEATRRTLSLAPSPVLADQ